MSVKQCQCGGALVEVPATHAGPVHCGELACGGGFDVIIHRFKTVDTIRFDLFISEETMPVPKELLLQIIDDKLAEGDIDKLLEYSHEYLKNRTHELRGNVVSKEPNKNINEAIARIIRSLEAAPGRQKEFEGLAAAFKTMRKLERPKLTLVKNALVKLPESEASVEKKPED